MIVPYEVIDELGDLLIILKPLVGELAPWPDQDDDDSYQDSEDEIDEDELLAQMEEVRREHEELLLEETVAGSATTEGSMATEIPARAEGVQVEVEAGTAMEIETVTETATEAETPHKDDTGSAEEFSDEDDSDRDDVDMQPECTFLVSSHILRRASPVLRRDLDPNGPWRQPEAQPDGLRRKHLEDLDPVALRHVLNVLHLQTSRVPDELDICTLAQVAIIVDYLQCHDAMGFALKCWMGKEGPDTVGSLVKQWKPGRLVTLALIVASVFKLGNLLRDAGQILVRHLHGQFDALGLPIAKQIISRLDGTREYLIDEMLDNMYELKDDLSSKGGICTADCNTMALGVLQRCLCAADLYPRPEAPFHGIRLVDIEGVATKFIEMPVFKTRHEVCKRSKPRCLLTFRLAEMFSEWDWEKDFQWE